MRAEKNNIVTRNSHGISALYRFVKLAKKSTGLEN